MARMSWNDRTLQDLNLWVRAPPLCFLNENKKMSTFAGTFQLSPQPRVPQWARGWRVTKCHLWHSHRLSAGLPRWQVGARARPRPPEVLGPWAGAGEVCGGARGAGRLGDGNMGWPSCRADHLFILTPWNGSSGSTHDDSAAAWGNCYWLLPVTPTSSRLDVTGRRGWW